MIQIEINSIRQFFSKPFVVGELNHLGSRENEKTFGEMMNKHYSVASFMAGIEVLEKENCREKIIKRAVDGVCEFDLDQNSKKSYI